MYKCTHVHLNKCTCTCSCTCILTQTHTHTHTHTRVHVHALAIRVPVLFTRNKWRPKKSPEHGFLRPLKLGFVWVKPQRNIGIYKVTFFQWEECFLAQETSQWEKDFTWPSSSVWSCVDKKRMCHPSLNIFTMHTTNDTLMYSPSALILPLFQPVILQRLCYILGFLGPFWYNITLPKTFICPS